MTHAGTGKKIAAERTFNLSELVGRKVIAKGERVGRLDEFVIMDRDRFAEVTHLCVRRPFGRAPLVVPWGKVEAFGDDAVTAELDEPERYANAFPASPVLLKDYILDKKVLDQKGRELEVVYDIGMALSGGKLIVLDVDLSQGALLRRMHLGWLTGLLGEPADARADRVPWSLVEPLPEEIGSFKGSVKLKILKEQLAEMPAVDLADILEEMGHEQRMAIFGELESEQASDTLEELEPKVQRDLIASLEKDKVARLVDEMTPGQAADLLAVLPRSEVEAIVKLLDREKGAKVQAILEKQEEKAVDFASSSYLRFPPGKTLAEACHEFQTAARGKANVMYLYVVDEAGKLLGVLDLKELLLGGQGLTLGEAMTANVVSLDPSSTLKRASELFGRYLFRALPIVDDEGRMLGVLSYRDVMALRHRFVE